MCAYSRLPLLAPPVRSAVIGVTRPGDERHKIQRRCIAETGLRVKEELLPMKKDQIDFLNAVLWISDSKTPSGVAEIPLTKLALEAFQKQVAISGNGDFLLPSDLNQEGHLRSLQTAWRQALKRAGIPDFRLYDLRSTCATRLSAGGVADEWAIQMLRQGDSQVFKKYSQMKLQMKREALGRINRRANEMSGVLT
jgi:integrase